MIHKIYCILFHLLFLAGFQKGLKFTVPVNIGASLALFTVALLISIFYLLSINLEFVTSQRFFFIILLFFIAMSLAYFLLNGQNKIISRPDEVIFERNNILLIIAYSIITIIIPILIFMKFKVGVYW